MARKKGKHEEEKIKEVKKSNGNKTFLLINSVLAVLLLAFLGLTLFLLYNQQNRENAPEAFTNNIRNYVNVYPERGVEKYTTSSTVAPEQSSTTSTTTQHTTTTQEATTTTATLKETETTTTTGSPPASGHETEKSSPDTGTVKVPDSPTTTIAQPSGFEPNIGVQQFISPDLADPGDIVEYSLTLINFGQGKALNVVVSEVLPEGLTYADTGTRFREWDFGDIEANGGKKNVTYHVEVGSKASLGAYDNVLTVNADNHNEFNITNSLNVVSNP